MKSTLEHDRRRAVRIIGRAEVEAIKRGQPARIGDERKACRSRIVHDLRAAVKAQPRGNFCRRAQRGIEPDRRILIAQRQGNGRDGRRERLRRRQCPRRWDRQFRAARSRRGWRGTPIAPMSPDQQSQRRSCAVLPSHQREEVDLGRCHLPGARIALRFEAGANGRNDFAFERCGISRRSAPARRIGQSAAPWRGRGRAHSRNPSRRWRAARRRAIPSPRRD